MGNRAYVTVLMPEDATDPADKRLLINEFNLRPAQCRALLIAAMAGDAAEKPARSGERNSPAR